MRLPNNVKTIDGKYLATQNYVNEKISGMVQQNVSGLIESTIINVINPENQQLNNAMDTNLRNQITSGGIIYNAVTSQGGIIYQQTLNTVNSNIQTAISSGGEIYNAISTQGSQINSTIKSIIQSCTSSGTTYDWDEI